MVYVGLNINDRAHIQCNDATCCPVQRCGFNRFYPQQWRSMTQRQMLYCIYLSVQTHISFAILLRCTFYDIFNNKITTEQSYHSRSIWCLCDFSFNWAVTFAIADFCSWKKNLFWWDGNILVCGCYDESEAPCNGEQGLETDPEWQMKHYFPVSIHHSLLTCSQVCGATLKMERCD